jgi:hypothetical protein
MDTEVPLGLDAEKRIHEAVTEWKLINLEED